MHAPSAYEYAIIRLVPYVERGECINIGVVLFCRQKRYLAAKFGLNEARLFAFAPKLDLETLREQTEHMLLVCVGGRASGPIGELPHQERFRWLTAPRSTIIQPSPVHVGLSHDPDATLDQLYRRMVEA